MSDDRRPTTDDRRSLANQRSPAISHGPLSIVHRPPSVELQIGELVLHGFAPGDGAAIGESLRSELTQLIVERGAPGRLEAGSTIELIDGGSFTMAPGARPEAVGARVARAVYSGLTATEAEHGRAR